MKYKRIALFFTLIFSSGLTLQILAQDKHQVEKTKVVIIEKVIDDNGKVTEQKKILEGDDALAYIAENPEISEAYKEVEMEVENRIDEDKGSSTTKKQYRFKVKDENGVTKELEWDGQGEVPKELEGLLDLELRGGEQGDGVTHTIKVDDTDKKTKLVIKKKGLGIEDVMDFDWEGDELPDEVREVLEQEGIELEELKDLQEKKQIRVIKKTKKSDNPKSDKKPQLGVNVGKDPNGAKIIGVNPDSAADVAGLQVGDVITQLDEFEVKDFMTLVDAISAHQPGDVILLKLIRDGNAISKEVTLKESVDPFPFKTWEEVMDLKK